MKKILILASLLALAACGNSSSDNDLTGQVKKVKNVTPIFCFDHKVADVSLGVMRNGVGSMSSEDVWLYVPNTYDAALLERASSTGSLVKIKYNTARLRWCVPLNEVTSVELVQ